MKNDWMMVEDDDGWQTKGFHVVMGDGCDFCRALWVHLSFTIITEETKHFSIRNQYRRNQHAAVRLKTENHNTSVISLPPFIPLFTTYYSTSSWVLPLIGSPKILKFSQGFSGMSVIIVDFRPNGIFSSSVKETFTITPRCQSGLLCPNPHPNPYP